MHLIHMWLLRMSRKFDARNIEKRHYRAIRYTVNSCGMLAAPLHEEQAKKLLVGAFDNILQKILMRQAITYFGD